MFSAKIVPESAQSHNKGILEGISGKSLRYFAYTGGVYNAQSINAVKTAHFEAALTVIPKILAAIPFTYYPGQIAIHHP